MEWITTSTILRDLKDDHASWAWQRLVERFHAPIANYARRMGLTEFDAEDVAQETLMEFIQSFRQDRYDREKGRLSHWLFGIAHHCALRQKRRAARDQAAGGSSSLNDIAQGQIRALTEWDLQWEQAMLQACLNRVRGEFEPQTLEIFERIARGDGSTADVAAALGVSVKAVYNAKHRVAQRIRQLRAELEDLDALPTS